MTGHTDRNVSTVPITARLRETAAHMIDRAALRHLHKIRSALLQILAVFLAA